MDDLEKIARDLESLRRSSPERFKEEANRVWNDALPLIEQLDLEAQSFQSQCREVMENVAAGAFIILAVVDGEKVLSAIDVTSSLGRKIVNRVSSPNSAFRTEKPMAELIREIQSIMTDSDTDKIPQKIRETRRLKDEFEALKLIIEKTARVITPR